MYMLGGWIDASRAKAAVELLRDRIAALRADPDAAARAFVTARRRVIIALTSLIGSASLLAAHAEADIELGRAPMSDLEEARTVQALTIEQMTPILGELDLARGAMLMRGPADPINAAFAALGRQPTLISFDQAAADAAVEEPQPRDAARSRAQRIRISDIEDAITAQSVSQLSPIELTVAANFALASLVNLQPPNERPADGGASGVAGSAQIGLRFLRRGSAGLHFGVASLDGSYAQNVNGIEIGRASFGATPIDLGAYFHMRFSERAWGGLQLGVHWDGVRFESETTWMHGIGIGVEGGYDMFVHGAHRFGAMLRAAGCYGADVRYSAFTLGLTYRR
jgi:hypothetical protein